MKKKKKKAFICFPYFFFFFTKKRKKKRGKILHLHILILKVLHYDNPMFDKLIWCKIFPFFYFPYFKLIGPILGQFMASGP